MSYCCPVDPEKKNEWEEHMFQEIDYLEHDIKKASETFSALGHPIRLKIAYFLSQTGVSKMLKNEGSWLR
jgi:ArsR family transcriptional regulator